MRSRLTVLVVGAALLSAACASTVQQQGLGAGAQSELDGGTAAGGAETSGLDAANSGSGTDVPGGTAGGTGPATAGRTATTTRTGSGPIAPARGGRILVGIPHLDNEQRNALIGAVGFQAAAPEDTKANYQHLIDDLNARGGILGRRVEPVFHVVNLAGTRATEEQAACADFTQDHKIHFAFTGAISESAVRCLLQANVGVVDTQWATINEADYEDLSGLVQPAAIALDRRSRVRADRLVAAKFFAQPAPAKVGILYYDEPHFQKAAQVLEQSLARHGVTVTSKQSVHFPNTVDEASQTAAGSQSAVLRFKTAGVTHVLTVEVDWFVTGFFALAAANQGYYPRYGLTSDHQIGNLRDQVPARSLEGAQFVGWYPVMDVADPKEYSAEAKACMDFLISKGEPMETPQQRKGAVWSCEAVHYLEAAVAAGGEPISKDRFVAGALGLGSSYRPTSTYRIAVGPRRGDAVAAVRDGAYDTGCSCFVYTGPPIPIG